MGEENWWDVCGRVREHPGADHLGLEGTPSFDYKASALSRFSKSLGRTVFLFLETSEQLGFCDWCILVDQRSKHRCGSWTEGRIIK